jgi:regulator of RNase E activity RraA
MNQYKTASKEILEFLRHTDTCTVSNAIESFDIRMRNEGYIHGSLRCMFPALPPVAGYAVTGRIRTTVPPVIRNRSYYNTPEWWDFIAGVPGPKVIVLCDSDDAPAIGAFFGQIHMEISKALGCVGYVSNGAVRDLLALKAGDFACFAGGVSASHAYAHIVEFGEPIEIGALKMATGDLLHADCHGVQKIPLEVVDQLPERVAQVLSREAELIEFCRGAGFSIHKLKELLAAANTFQPFVQQNSVFPENGKQNA